MVWASICRSLAEYSKENIATPVVADQIFNRLENEFTLADLGLEDFERVGWFTSEYSFVRRIQT